MEIEAILNNYPKEIKGFIESFSAHYANRVYEKDYNYCKQRFAKMIVTILEKYLELHRSSIDGTIYSLSDFTRLLHFITYFIEPLDVTGFESDWFHTIEDELEESLADINKLSKELFDNYVKIS